MGIAGSASTPGAVFTSQVGCTYKDIENVLLLTHTYMKKSIQQKHSLVPVYVSGQQVWLSTTNLKVPFPAWKLTQKWISPYEITSTLSSIVRLKLTFSI